MLLRIMQRDKMALMFLVGCVLAGFGFVLILAACTNLYDLHRLALVGQTTSGRVTEAVSFRSKYGPGYYVSYAYSVDGHPYGSRRLNLALSNWNGLSAGQTIPVDYLPDSPDISLPSLTGELTYATERLWFNMVFPGVVVTTFGCLLIAVSYLTTTVVRGP